MGNTNTQFIDRIDWWHLKAEREKDPWIRFILYYFIFDAYLSEGSQSSNQTKKLRWFLDNDNPFKKSFNGCWKTRLLPGAKALKSLSPIMDMRLGSTEEIVLNDENSLEEIFKFIFQIRCNLFHGSKDMMDGKDSNLVEYAGDFLKDSIDWWWVSK